MSSNVLFALALLVGAFFLRRWVLKEHPLLKGNNPGGIIWAPVIIVFMGMTLSKWGEEPLNLALRMDSLRHLSTYTPFLGDGAKEFISLVESSAGVQMSMPQDPEVREIIITASIAKSLSAFACFLCFAFLALNGWNIYKWKSIKPLYLNISYGVVAIACVISSFIIADAENDLLKYLHLVDAASSSFSIVIIALIVVLAPYYFYRRSVNSIYSINESTTKVSQIIPQEIQTTNTNQPEINFAEKKENLIELKELLDSGAINQEEFDKIKKEVLTS